MSIKVLFNLFIILLLLPLTYSQYYADVDIIVEPDGRVSIGGITNLNDLKGIQDSQLYTSKKGGVWTFNLTTEEKFDDFIFELELPKYAEINYIKTTPTFRISDENNKIKIIGTGENKPLTLIIQYEVHNVSGILSNNYLVIFLIILLIGGSLTLRHFGFRLRKEEETKKSIDDSNDLAYDYTILPQRQKDIIDILKDKNKITQKELEEMMEIPKSSVSRNIKTLEVKGIVTKQQVGKVNYLSLSK